MPDKSFGEKIIDDLQELADALDGKDTATCKTCGKPTAGNL